LQLVAALGQEVAPKHKKWFPRGFYGAPNLGGKCGLEGVINHKTGVMSYRSVIKRPVVAAAIVSDSY
jgi:hypothetical protein